MIEKILQAIKSGVFAWEQYVEGKNWAGIFVHTRPLLCLKGQIGFSIDIYNAKGKVSTIDYNWNSKTAYTRLNKAYL